MICVLGVPQYWIKTTVESDKCVCPICNKQYKNNKTLKSHMVQDCQRRELFSCGMCEYKCKRNYHLKVHMKYKHGVAFKTKRRRGR